MDIAFLLNGESVTLANVDPTKSTLDWLRENKKLTGTKEGCNEGDCGACTIMMIDETGAKAVNSCILFLGQLNGKSLTTIEGLSQGNTLHPVQDAMVSQHGSQCGFCTPGIVMSLATAQLNDDQNHDDVLAGNLCRCTGYAPIIRAAQHAHANSSVKQSEAQLHTAKAALVDMQIASTAKNPEKPKTIDALTDAMSKTPQATLIAGATDVGLWATKALKQVNPVIFLNEISELKQINLTETHMRIGAGVSIETLRYALRPLYPHFGEMLRRFASLQVRNVATLGGNIANGSPIADTPPALIALDATLHLRSATKSRSLSLESFFIDYGKQDLQDGEFVEAISFERQEDRLKVYKLSKRFDQDISAALGAFNIRITQGVVSSARIAFGGMAATPKRAKNVETALLNKPWNLDTINNVTAIFAEDFSPMTDMRASSSYRMKAAQNMLKRYWYEDQSDSPSTFKNSVLEVEA